MKQSANKQYIALVILFVWALVAQCTSSAFAIHNQLLNDKGMRLPFGFVPYSNQIRFVALPYKNKGISEGDRVVALNGNNLDGMWQVSQLRYHLKVGRQFIVTIERNGQRFDVPITVLPENSPAIGWTFVIALEVIFPLVSLLVGFYIAFARPLDLLAWITMAMLAAFGQILVDTVSWAIWRPWYDLLLIYNELLSNTWPLWMLLFALYFPTPFPWLARKRWLIYALAAPVVPLIIIDIYGGLMSGYHLNQIAWLGLLRNNTNKGITILFLAYISCFFFFLSLKRAKLSGNDARRRLQVMLVGCGLSLAPLLPFVAGQFGLAPMLPSWLAVMCFMALLLFPLTMAYVIVVQRAMDVRMAVRTGVQYALASTGTRILQALLTIGVVILTVHFEQEAEHRLEGVAILLAGIAAVYLLGRLGRQVLAWMDRRFFREAYNAERILSDLSNSVAGIRDVKRLLETVTHRIADSLHVPRIAVLLNEGGHFQPAYAVGFSANEPPVRFSEHASTVRTLRRLGSPSRIYFDDPQSWVHGTSEVEQEHLRRLNTQLLLPLSLNTKLLGIISLGSKRSELPYTKGDLRLLSAVAAQTGLALENAHLTETIRHEIAQRERLDRELEIARDVQQRLFPQKLPVVQGLDFCGYCRPAQGVGGDYYDFIRLTNGCLGIAIGDVSGKGISAALMMASLQASLRGQTIRPSDTISETMQHLNRLVFESSPSNRYATFFYAQFDPNGNKLKYVNAGHNPPMLRRKKGSTYEFLRLEEGGTVVGLFPELTYTEAEVELLTGDVLLAFTDGISEAMNRTEEEFDEPRLISALEQCPGRSAADISSYVIDQVDSFTAGARQHDDMTLVVLRMQ